MNWFVPSLVVIIFLLLAYPLVAKNNITKWHHLYSLVDLCRPKYISTQISEIFLHKILLSMNLYSWTSHILGLSSSNSLSPESLSTWKAVSTSCALYLSFLASQDVADSCTAKTRPDLRPNNITKKRKPAFQIKSYRVPAKSSYKPLSNAQLWEIPHTCILQNEKGLVFESVFPLRCATTLLCSTSRQFA